MKHFEVATIFLGMFTSVNIPDPNINATKQSDIIEISPNVSFVHEEVANNVIVNSDDNITATFRFPKTLLFSYTTRGIVSISFGLIIKRINNQEITVQNTPNGSATAIHRPKEIGIPTYNKFISFVNTQYHIQPKSCTLLTCSKYEAARAFCKLEIGVIMPSKSKLVKNI